MSVASTNQTRLTESMKNLYQADQQVKFLHLQAEVETLLVQLQALKQQRLTAAGVREDN
ncbi:MULTISPECIES: hypothetical protein [Microseira]|uniref:Uncharacterized protein n=1 Tax=Microseira wollei NIES-4236 TaxID=2530354 RepID=A0AAV3X465_9CYAN|nr:hypothetical protein [Microseira wollei]GET37058.1 hypothetical protein MiSe_18110 [Microseira wollei NIES-4236]